MHTSTHTFTRAAPRTEHTPRARVIDRSLSLSRRDHPSTRVASCRMSARVFKVAELSVATNGFSEARLVGRGGFAKVYRGSSLLETGEDVAVKRWDDGSDAAALMNELETLTRIAHY